MKSKTKASGLPIRWSSLPPGRRSCAGSRLPSYDPTALNCVADPATGFTPEAPRATVAAITAPSACGLRYRVTRTTDSFRFPPSTWPAGQTERLAITSKSTWAPGRRSCAGRRLPSSVPTALNGVAYANGARYQLIYRWKANVVAKG